MLSVCLPVSLPCPVIWSLCPTPVHVRDSVLLPRQLWWFLLHGNLCSATALSQLPPHGLECLAARSLYSAVFVIMPAATEDPPFLLFLLFWLTSGTFLHDINVHFWPCSIVLQCLHLHHINPVVMVMMIVMMSRCTKRMETINVVCLTDALSKEPCLAVCSSV